uniref:Protein kinase domain-containing protein n=1 Tax=Ananas comosus var. bracteatus TaxID=296719 RepID=A0A6V7P2L5_ANACO|nr:unnamed protein product [Ananas comosus var. bracteatus]
MVQPRRRSRDGPRGPGLADAAADRAGDRAGDGVPPLRALVGRHPPRQPQVRQRPPLAGLRAAPRRLRLPPLVNPSLASAAMFAYRSPESLRHHHVSAKSDVYCLGILLLELLTGKFPSQYLHNAKGGTDLVLWATTVAAEDREEELLDPAIVTAAMKAAVPDMKRLLRVGIDCIEPEPDRRPDMKEAVARIEEVAAAAVEALKAARVAPAKDGLQPASAPASHAAYVRDGLGSGRPAGREHRRAVGSPERR